MLIKLWQSSATSLFLFQPRLVFLLFRFPSLPLPAAIMCGSTHRGENLWGRITGEHKTPLHYDIATVLQGIDHHWAEIDWLRVGRRNPIWMTVPSHPASAVLHRTIWWTEQHAAQMCQKGFVVNNNLSRMYFDFSVFCVFNSIFVFIFFFRCEVSKYAAVSVADKVKIVFDVLTFESRPLPIFHPGHIMPFWHMASQKDGSVSMPAYWVFGWTNIQQIMKHKAEEKVGAVYSSILSPLLLLAPPLPTANSGKIFDGGIDTKSMEEEERGEGRPICLESIWAKRVPNKQIRLSLITISQTGGAA